MIFDLSRSVASVLRRQRRVSLGLSEPVEARVLLSAQAIDPSIAAVDYGGIDSPEQDEFDGFTDENDSLPEDSSVVADEVFIDAAIDDVSGIGGPDDETLQDIELVDEWNVTFAADDADKEAIAFEAIAFSVVDDWRMWSPVVVTSGAFDSILAIETWPGFDENGELMQSGTLLDQNTGIQYVSPTEFTLTMSDDPAQMFEDWGITDYTITDSGSYVVPVFVSDGLDAFYLSTDLASYADVSVLITLNPVDASETPQHISLPDTVVNFQYPEYEDDVWVDDWASWSPMIVTTGGFESNLTIETWPGFDENGQLIDTGTLVDQNTGIQYVSPTEFTLTTSDDPAQMFEDWGITDYTTTGSGSYVIPVFVSDGLDAFYLSTNLASYADVGVLITLNPVDASGTPQYIRLPDTAVDIQYPDTGMVYSLAANSLGGIEEDGIFASDDDVVQYEGDVDLSDFESTQDWDPAWAWRTLTVDGSAEDGEVPPQELAFLGSISADSETEKLAIQPDEDSESLQSDPGTEPFDGPVVPGDYHADDVADSEDIVVELIDKSAEMISDDDVQVIFYNLGIVSGNESLEPVSLQANAVPSTANNSTAATANSSAVVQTSSIVSLFSQNQDLSGVGTLVAQNRVLIRELDSKPTSSSEAPVLRISQLTDAASAATGASSDELDALDSLFENEPNPVPTKRPRVDDTINSATDEEATADSGQSKTRSVAAETKLLPQSPEIPVVWLQPSSVDCYMMQFAAGTFAC